jgi:hypothetical protein
MNVVGENSIDPSLLSRGEARLMRVATSKFIRLRTGYNMVMMNYRRVLATMTLIALGTSTPVVWGAPPSFEAVSRILGKRCLHCHNDLDRKGDFSLESRSALEDSGYVEPGDAANSHLISTIVVVDGKPSMPKDGEPLSAQEIETITSWIEAGANWPEGVQIRDVVDNFDWWSFQPIRRPAVPTVATDRAWARNPIDAFIAEQHRQRGLTQAPSADRRTLIRRLTYDLTGLPPTPSEIDLFLNDTSDRAYEDLVDRLLSSRHYGEHWARHWLDVVNYADTCGYDKDKLRNHAWPYRDYVIRSFNEDKPYHRFVQEQVAGDALFPGEPDGILGLGFLAAGPWDFIGHVEVPESKIDGKVARNLDRDEMVTTTMNTFCSVTVQCARCHNHKFDPITQEHYYSLQSVFAAVDRAERPYDLDPLIEQTRSKARTRLQEAKHRLDQLDKEVAEQGGSELANLDQRIKSLKSNVGVQKSARFGYHSAIAPTSDVTKWVEVDLGRPVKIQQIVLHAAHDEFAGIGAGFGFPVRYRVDLGTGHEQDDPETLYESAADESNPGLVPVHLEADGQTAQVIRVTAMKLAERKNDFMLALAELRVIDIEGNEVASGATVRALDSIEAPVRWAKANLVDSDWATASNPSSEQALAESERQRAEIWNRINTPERQRLRDQLTDLISKTRKELDELPRGRMVYAAATDFQPQGNFKPTGGEARSIFVLHRGDVERPLKPVGPGRIPFAADDPWQIQADAEAERRAKLALWLTDPNHPLVWRSIVNRVWQYHFGEGIVSTPNDFGRMGAMPSHPELLDWLATEFRDNGQSFKELHRLIVTSSVYRQSSKHDPGNAAIDNDNRYLWRMNRRRLTAEEIRDSILAVSGCLNTDMGGPGFYLFELEKTEHSPHYEYHKFDPSDPKSHRRSIYRFVVRSQPDPFMTTLDCADSSQSTPKRLETLTSLQALSLLNNRFNLEMSKRFAERLKGEHHNVDAQVSTAFNLITGRQPTALESKQLNQYAEQNGMSNLCRILFNLSEFVFID